ncbi:MAG: SGNH/GDSL hydrolase family protein [Verrucomicrobia bacterium]|nr:SGNH/GDSL hydrolase family protein [Verrucomicrobiota bacterium]
MRAFTRSFALLLILWLALELATRFVFVASMEGRFDYGYHPTAGFEEVDGQVNLKRTGGRRFFPQSFEKKRPEGAYRVMVIGDSVARGTSVQESYAGYLQKELQAQGIKAECLNLGLPGFGARRKDLVVQQVLNYQPNLVILHVGTSNEYEDEREWGKKENFKSAHPKNWLMHSLAMRQAYAIKSEKINDQLLPQTVRAIGSAQDAMTEGIASQDPENQKLWKQLVTTTTKQSVKRLQDAGIPTLVVTQVNYELRHQTVTLDDSSLADWTPQLVADQVLLLPMKSIFTPDQARELFMDSAHVLPEGHRLMAKSIATLLAEKAWLPLAVKP